MMLCLKVGRTYTVQMMDRPIGPNSGSEGYKVKNNGQATFTNRSFQLVSSL